MFIRPVSTASYNHVSIPYQKNHPQTLYPLSFGKRRNRNSDGFYTTLLISALTVLGFCAELAIIKNLPMRRTVNISAKAKPANHFTTVKTNIPTNQVLQVLKTNAMMLTHK